MDRESEEGSTPQVFAAHHDEDDQEEAKFGKEGKEIAPVMHTLGVKSSRS